MSLLSLKLFGHCSMSGDETIGADCDRDEVITLGINEATGLPLVSGGMKGCPGMVDVAGNPRGTDITEHSDLNTTLDVSAVDNDMTWFIDTRIETDWECGMSSMESGIDDFACNNLSGFESDWQVTAFQTALLVLFVIVAVVIWLLPTIEKLIEKYIKTDD